MQYNYDTAQVCVNGHLINGAMTIYPIQVKDYCRECGAKTINNCKKCSEPIEGYPFMLGRVIGDPKRYRIPKYCHKCGQQYPWTESRQEAAKQLIELSENLNSDEKNNLISAINDIVIDTPKTSVGVLRFKQVVAKAGKEVAAGLKEVLIDVVSETAKKAIWG
ncbi:MAG: hypothetical protein JWR05_3373 [Mucilaginibacter sp.]|nr:hypothetical protein [Mucilaginibacter sp.]